MLLMIFFFTDVHNGVVVKRNETFTQLWMEKKSRMCIQILNLHLKFNYLFVSETK